MPPPGRLGRRANGPIAALFLLLLSAVIGCRPADHEPTDLRFRLLTESPAEILDLRPSAKDVAVHRSWSFRGPAELGSWDLRLPGDPRYVKDGLELTDAVELRVDVPEDVEGFRRVRLDLKGALATLKVSWARDGYPFGWEETAELPLIPLKAGPPYAVDLSRARSGGRLRLEMRPQGRRAMLSRVDLGLPRVDGEALAARLGRPWLVDLDHEVRPAFLTPPGVPVEHALTVPPDGRLTASIGFVGSASEALDFVATFRPTEGSSAGSTGSVGSAGSVGSVGSAEGLDDEGQATVLAEQVLEPGVTGWRDFRADLSAFAGRDGVLRLETRRRDGPPTEGFDLGQGTPVWAGPEVRTSGRASSAAAKPPNLVLVSLDTLRADHLSLYGYPRETAPNLTRWARRHALTFRNTVAPAGWTLPSHTTLFTGLNTLTHGVNYADPVPGSFELLAETLRRAGYHTVAYTGGSYLHPRYGLAQGFDRFRYWPISPGPDGQGEDLEGQVPRLLEDIERLPEPFFLFFHTYEIHSPYHRRNPYFHRFLDEAGVSRDPGGRMMAPTRGATGADQGFVKRQHLVRAWAGGQVPLNETDQPWIDAVYDSGIAFADEYLGRVLEALESTGAARRSVTVVTSDHGEALGDNGDAEHGMIYDHNLMVPLIVAVPGRAGGGTYEPQVRLEDVTPTLLDVLGLPVPRGLDGVSLAPALDGRVAPVPREAWSYSANRNWGVALRIANRLKLHYRDTAWAPTHGDLLLFDLRDDPGEARNLAPEHPRTQPMAQRVVERLRSRRAGLRWTLDNRSGETLRVRIVSRLVNKRKVKGVAIPAPGVAWVEAGEMTVEVPAGESAPVIFHGADESSRVRLSVAAGDDWPAMERNVSTAHVTELGGRLSLFPVDGRWRRPRPEAAASAPVRLVVEWNPEEAVPEAAPESLDPELREQLRALGYLD